MPSKQDMKEGVLETEVAIKVSGETRPTGFGHMHEKQWSGHSRKFLEKAWSVPLWALWAANSTGAYESILDVENAVGVRVAPRLGPAFATQEAI